jgi:hypothetical protein
MTCIVDQEPHSARIMGRGMCSKHYLRWNRHGDPLVSFRIKGDDRARFLSKVDQSGPGSCHTWRGHHRNGYGSFFQGGKMRIASRVAYELFIGPIPNGLTIDHVKSRGCQTTLCVNPAHLEAVTMRENVLRSGRPADRKAQTHCMHGHEFSPENTRFNKNGTRSCRQCDRDNARKSWLRKKNLVR